MRRAAAAAQAVAAPQPWTPHRSLRSWHLHARKYGDAHRPWCAQGMHGMLAYPCHAMSRNRRLCRVALRQKHWASFWAADDTVIALHESDTKFLILHTRVFLFGLPPRLSYSNSVQAASEAKNQACTCAHCCHIHISSIRVQRYLRNLCNTLASAGDSSCSCLFYMVYGA